MAIEDRGYEHTIKNWESGSKNLQTIGAIGAIVTVKPHIRRR